MKNDIAIETFERLADEVNGSLRTDYSGRYMYDKTCMAIDVSSDNFIRCIELAGSFGIFGASYDQMGKGMIVYWTKYQYGKLSMYENDEDEKEIQRRDEKNGLYPAVADDCN